MRTSGCDLLVQVGVRFKVTCEGSVNNLLARREVTADSLFDWLS